MKVPLVLLGGIVVLSVTVAKALSCVCSRVECDLLTEQDCPGGLTLDPCKCCKVCARVEGEPCGGLFGFSGSCAVGLQCVIKNLLHHAREVDEGVCTKIPGRWRRHCPHGPKMSGPGCNLIGEGPMSESEKVIGSGKCVCGPQVRWCPGEPEPYVYKTLDECKLNLAAKVAYDALSRSEDEDGDGVQGAACPEDSMASEDGGCKCVSPCPPAKCRTGQRPIQVKAAVPETPGSCCPLYNCVPSDSVSWIPTEDPPPSGSCIDDTGVHRRLGESWQDGPCVNCYCENGTVSCQVTMCKSCDNHPSPPLPGECCPRCMPSENRTTDSPARCLPLRHCALQCEQGFVNDEHGCPTCNCIKGTEGSLQEEDKLCPKLPHCGLDCEVLEKDEGGCPVCACQGSPEPNAVIPVAGQDDVIFEEKTICPKLNCDLHCEHGLLMDENDCTLCQCKPVPDCPSMAGCRKKCLSGYKTNKRGCSICRCHATCIDRLNKTHPEGSSWDQDVCTTCTCEAGGRLSCKETVCSVACSNPLPPKPGTCCPVCPIVESNGKDIVHQTTNGWGTLPITIIVVLALLCLLLMVHIVRSRFRGRLSPSQTAFSSYPPQYYKCVPVYDTPVHRNEKMVPL